MPELSQAAQWVGGRLDGRDVSFVGASIDTRSLLPGQLFVALPGNNVDGHDFVRQAEAAGAAAALVQRSVSCRLPQLLVPDVAKALGMLAAAWRQQYRGPVVALTGSNGKTSTKEMLTAILAETGPVWSTRGNLNNALGLPLTLLGLREDQHAAVVEMGASGPGEIAELTTWADPDVGLVTNAGRAHLQGFKDLPGVAWAKGELFAGLRSDATAIWNADDAQAAIWKPLIGSRKALSFGRAAQADFRLLPESLQQRFDENGLRCEFSADTPWGEQDYRLRLAGEHNVINALAAAAAACAAGAQAGQLRSGLARLAPVSGRLSPVSLPGLRVVDDSYNANPDSVQAAIRWLAQLPGKRWLVLGEMAELGSGAREMHAVLGALALEAGLERVLAIGSMAGAAAIAFGNRKDIYPDAESLARAVAEQADEECIVLVKGSRSAGMERVIDALREELS